MIFSNVKAIMFIQRGMHFIAIDSTPQRQMSLLFVGPGLISNMIGLTPVENLDIRRCLHTFSPMVKDVVQREVISFEGLSTVSTTRHQGDISVISQLCFFEVERFSLNNSRRAEQVDETLTLHQSP